MYKDSYKNRKKYYVTLFVSIYVIIFTVLALVVWANWKYIKIILKGQQQELSIEQYQFNELFEKIGYLEELSRKYNKNDYQLRAVAYIRDAQYNGGVWDMFFDKNDLNKFNLYVETNQGDKKLTDLRNLGENYTFIVPQTKQEVDFYHMFATINASMKYNNYYVTDLAGWGGDIGQLANEVNNEYFADVTDKDFSKITNEKLENLYTNIKNKMNSSSSFGVADRNADIDAVNICSMLDDYNSVYVASIVYYANITTQNQSSKFKANLDIKGKTIEEATESLQTRLYIGLNFVSSYGLNLENLGIYYQDDDSAEDYNKCNTIYNYCIKAFVECLN